jgi:hypothetical protein
MIRYSAAVTLRTVSLQSGASSPMMRAGSKPLRFVAGSQS